MDTNTIATSIKALSASTGARRMPRGMLDQLAPSIFEATKSGVSLNQIRLHLEEKQGLLVTVAAISRSLQRNGLTEKRNGRNTHNVCHVPKESN